MAKTGRPKTAASTARCLKHPGSRVISKEVRTTKSGVVRRFSCTPALGSPHTFSVPVVDAQAPAVPVVWSAPPACPDHPRSKVVRNGTYGRATPKPRQRYRCTPTDGTKPHSFTPPLPRDHVHSGEEHCEHCDELRGIHRGETAVARRHSWSTRIVARGLEQLANGATYADVSRWALRVTGTKRSRISPRPKATKRKKKVSERSKESRNAWHIAADWVEAFSPVIYGPIDLELRTKALAKRAEIDRMKARGELVDRPQVVLVDEVPVWGRDLNRKKKMRRDAGYYVLALAELYWPDEEVNDPFLVVAPPVVKLRLVRAMANTTAVSWRLIFDELGYAPDYIVADAGTGIGAAVRAHFDPKKTRFIPSLWHLAKKVEAALADTAGAMTVTTAGKELIEPLANHVRQLSRGSGVLASTATWKKWWDDLFEILKANQLPSEEVRKRRTNYERAMAAVIVDLAANPHIPVSTGGLETLIAKHISPMLAMRRTSFANIERTNLLFDLVVARNHDAFDNLGEVARLLRTDSEQHQGWSVPLRSIADPRPEGGVYSSLRDSTLLTTLAAQRGIQ